MPWPVSWVHVPWNAPIETLIATVGWWPFAKSETRMLGPGLFETVGLWISRDTVAECTQMSNGRLKLRSVESG